MPFHRISSLLWRLRYPFVLSPRLHNQMILCPMTSFEVQDRSLLPFNQSLLGQVLLIMIRGRAWTSFKPFQHLRTSEYWRHEFRDVRIKGPLLSRTQLF